VKTRSRSAYRSPTSSPARAVPTRQDLTGERWVTQLNGDVCHAWVLLSIRTLLKLDNRVQIALLVHGAGS
jgi:hypothetical protein